MDKLRIYQEIKNIKIFCELENWLFNAHVLNPMS